MDNLTRIMYEQRPVIGKYDIRSVSQEAAKRFKTVMIGALHEFEAEFGNFWGKDKYPKTELERAVADRYDVVRKKVLDRGNNECRLFNRTLQKLEDLIDG